MDKENIKTMTLVLDFDVLKKYNEFYFGKYPHRRVAPIERPLHPSINVWMIKQRMAMNDLKQKWKDFCTWWITSLGLNGLNLEEYTMEFTYYMPSRRRCDPDNMSPKFIMDGFTNAGFIADDDGKHCKGLTLKTDYDKENPRTEIYIEYKEQ